MRIGRFSEAQADDLASALVLELQNESLAELVGSPLLLALLTLIHSEEAKLPEARAVVCDRAITYMLADAAKWRPREAGATTVATPALLSVAIRLAHRSYAEEEKGMAASNGLSESLVLEIASEVCDEMKRAEAVGQGLSPSDLSRRMLRSHGLLLDAGEGRYKFAHRSFQEFLAGQYYAAGAHHAEAKSRASSIHWREPFRLMASFAGHEGENLYYILTLIEDLVSADAQASVSYVQLGAEMLAEIGRRRLALKQFANVIEAGGLWARAQAKISVQVEDPSLTLAERERNAAVLAHLGDPRLEAKATWENLVRVKGGAATLGSRRLDQAALLKIGGFLGGLRLLEFGDFKIGRYPVTNAEFRRFVDSDGYFNLDYWKGRLAQGWVSGNEAVLDEIRQHWLSTLHEHHAKEIRDGEIDLSAIEQESIQRTAPRQCPYYWHDRRFNQSNQPVVGINWWEAVAFCEWATFTGHQTGCLELDKIVALPTEFEWEYASRPSPDDRVYPWGDEWWEHKAHVSTNVLNMRQPSPVGIYLEHWANGPCDMAGNVWEWTASLHLPYDSAHDSRRLSYESLDERVVRGSSWYNFSTLAACSARAVDRSYNLFYDVGFRIAVIPADSERVGSH